MNTDHILVLSLYTSDQNSDFNSLYLDLSNTYTHYVQIDETGILLFVQFFQNLNRKLI